MNEPDKRETSKDENNTHTLIFGSGITRFIEGSGLQVLNKVS